MKTIAQKQGNSIIIRVPNSLADKYDILNGTEIIFKETEKGIYIERAIEERLAQVTDVNRHKDIDWGKPTGKEIW